MELSEENFVNNLEGNFVNKYNYLVIVFQLIWWSNCSLKGHQVSWNDNYGDDLNQTLSSHLRNCFILAVKN